MSTLVVEVCEVKAVYPHPNADALEFITVKGWPVIVQKALGLEAGRRVVYFPPDSVLPPELADRLGIAKYLAPLPREFDGTRKPGLRVRAARLRGEASYGTIDHAVDPAWEVGLDVKDRYGVTKFEPPVRPTDGDALPSVEAFHRYTGIENIRNFPDVFRPGEEVAISEKLHGKNCRLGLVPLLYRGPFSWEAVEAQTYGSTTMCPPEAAGKFPGREGCVVAPVSERYDPALGGSGRVILKSISADYLARKGGTDEH